MTSVEPSPLRRLLGAIREYRTVFGREVEEEEDGPVILDGAVLFFESQERRKVCTTDLPINPLALRVQNASLLAFRTILANLRARFIRSHVMVQDAAFSSGYPFEEGQGWEGVLDDFVSVCDSKEPGEPGGTMLLCGGQDSGKSTFGRWMMNKLLSRYPRIEFVDLDCGQTEFGPPGIISVTSVSSPVFGAPFTHGQNPVDARFIGSASPKGDPAAFFQSVVSLLEHHRERSLAGEQVPTVINTNGWVKGLGLQLILDTIRVAAPDMVVQLETSVAGRNLPGLSPLPPRELQLWACPDPSSADDPKVAVLPAVRWDNLPQKGKSFHFAPKNLRELALLSYFHSENVDGTAPWRVPLDAVRLAAPPDLIPPTEVLRVLNASIIGLLDSAGGASDYENGDLFVPVDPTRRCYGLGIVRAATTDLDTAEAEIYVSTPLQLARVCPRVIAVTQVQLPEAMLTPGGPYLSDFPTGGGIGGQVRKGRRNLGRKHAPSGP